MSSDGNAGGDKRRYAPSKMDVAEMIISVFIMSFGVVLSVKAGLGTSPISSLPYVISIASNLTLGTTMLIVNTAFIIMEWAIMRDKAAILTTLSQLPFTLVFSLFVDFIVSLTDPWQVTGIIESWILVVISSAVIGFGIVLEIDANVSLLADDGLILAIHRATKVRLDKVMVIFDVVFVASAFVLSYVLFEGFVGVGAGTIFAGLTLGLFVKFFTKIVKRYIRKDGHISC